MSRSSRNRLKNLPSVQESTPTLIDIQSLCREIRSAWSDSQRKKRSHDVRLDGEGQQFRAHLRFLEFLATRTEQNS